MSMITCETCDGSGHVEQLTNLTWAGDEWVRVIECPVCHGNGEVEESEEGKMPEKWVIHNFVTGEDAELPRPKGAEGEPTFAWIEGWNAGMDGYHDPNPYDQFTLEAHNWDDGFLAAEEGWNA